MSLTNRIPACALLLAFLVSAGCASAPEVTQAPQPSISPAMRERMQRLAETGIPKDACPICDGKLTVAALVTPPTDPAKSNLSVWNGSICANFVFTGESPFCEQCFFAYSTMMKAWQRSAEAPDSFFYPLAPSIRNVPLPLPRQIQSRVVYSQTLKGTNLTEDVSFWCDHNRSLIAKLRTYAAQNNLHFSDGPKDGVNGPTFIQITTRK